MKQMGLSYEQALELVMKKRWVSPNQGKNDPSCLFFARSKRSKHNCLRRPCPFITTGFEQQLKQYQERLGIAKKPTMVYCN